jgi:subtilisin family serine protease
MFAGRWVRVVAAVVVVGLVPGWSPAAAASAEATIPGADAPNAVRDQYLVGLREASTGVAARARELVERYGGEVRHTYPKRQGFATRMSEAQARRLAADPAVAFLHQDLHMSYQDTFKQGPPNAPVPSWGLDRLDATLPAYDDSFSLVATGAGVRIYVIDSGIRITHQDFYGRASYGWDFAGNDAVADDCNGHGTEVAGIAGGAAAHGVAKLAEVVALKVGDCGGPTFSNIVAAVEWATANAVLPAVVNISIGQPSACGFFNPIACILEGWFEDDVDDAIDAGLTVVAPAGNDAGDACDDLPAAFSRVITVASTDDTDTRAASSNYGSCVDIFAPGEWVGTLDNATDTGEVRSAGSSMAAPHVAGVAAMVLSAHPTWSPARVTGAVLADANRGVVHDPGSGSPNLLVHSWAGVEEFFCERRTERLNCELDYYDGPAPDTAESIYWYVQINGGSWNWEPSWDGLAFVSAECIAGWSYRFRIGLFHASGLSATARTASYLCTSSPPHY